MLHVDEDAVICDLAETYHILDYKALPVKLLAVLCSGLRDDSRIKMKLQDAKHIPVSFVVPQIADNLALIRYAMSKEGAQVPQMITAVMVGDTKKENGFASGEAFEAARERLIKGINDG